MNLYVKLLIFILTGILSGFSITSQGADGETDMMFHGTLIAPPPCTINDGERIDVDFGDRVGVSKVDGVNYRIPVNYHISCEQSGSNWAMRLSLNGTPADFDSDALSSNITDLGIRIYRNDVAFTPNSVVDIDPENPPVLEAVPVKRVGAILNEGAFESWATLLADYQ
ncbi:fimbrial protein [Klebsiella aerogenes]|uniref:fimbrial protein n=1 Tax=Klebsiella aerogenes TaxID=548 RepID=UPI002550EE7F|nr:fimbrial protein [Klebsiella aerogenes]MDK7100078.1 fimbrial protein [Klebsiella aerogenes]MDK7645551.1 fimbrial protein [Klebsiella aerogenes]MDK7850450.1 fimbrial protein [Klebsiella aerogenes]MDK8313041.1 fimbrial protein [Klebsiella aerogenes]